jgi:hypothetical protein
MIQEILREKCSDGFWLNDQPKEEDGKEIQINRGANGKNNKV